MAKIKLPSGAELSITLAPFAESKGLYQAILKDIQHLKIDGEQEMDYNFLKDILCAGLSSDGVDKALTVCMNRATYNNLKIDENTFEPEKARQDYLLVCFEVAKVNIEPFTKSLYAKFSTVLAKLKKDPA